MSISVSNVSKYYGSQAALKNVSFEIKSGQIVGFLGPNGAGKSTMMKILTGYLPASEGETRVCGFNVNENSTGFRQQIGYLPEQNPIYADMYVTEYLHFTGSIYKIPNLKDKVEEIIRLTGLTPERHKKTGQLSKGYKQRVGLAQALLPDPEVLILDEPTTGLDPNQIAGVRELIKELGKSKTILLSTHIMQEVKAICERVIIIHQGQIVADEHPDKLENLGLTKRMTVEVLFEPRPEFEQIITIPGIEEAKLLGDRWLLTGHPEIDIRPAIFNYAVHNGTMILEATPHQQSLEEVFHALTI
ncbi:ATP-binding cassette domain-containing protein [Geofilum sp. OHC36d9]|uniref:ATP-binding cassette domain-containing protein n=1 Tax=Geofilum sp. OHC36d9 TaxID=3458413 RepID=UPI0040346179